MTKRVTITSKKPDGSKGWLDGETVELLMHRRDDQLEVDYGLAFIPNPQAQFDKGSLTFVQKQFDDGKWVLASHFPFSKTMSDEDLDHWLTMLTLKG